MTRASLDPLDPHEVAELFATLLELPEERRFEGIEDVATGRPTLQAELASLLAAHRRAAAFLEQPPVADFVANAGRRVPRAGDRVGPYRLVSEIGRGGMGTVFRARREDGGFEQEVALKVIGHGVGLGLLHDRFLRERQILARLVHSNIARLLDGGVTEKGQPYFAMELVSGQPMTAWCDERRAPVSERVGLFIQACQAVQHAHMNLVVHRDLKPSNIFVSDDGRIKLLDFGIAKLLDDDPDDRDLTRSGSPLTRDYAAPEQLLGQPATTATDVYSLGVVLHEFLTGRLPPSAVGILDRDGAATSEVTDTAHRVGHQGGTGSLASIDDDAAAARASTPAKLRRTLSHDLDAILRQALHVAPERRYGTVEALGEDLRRWREGAPVVARRPTRRYRLGKFIRRHRVAVVASAAALLALVAGLVLSLWQANIADRERETARRIATRAEEVQTFLVGLFEGADPAEAKGEDITARELLERGLVRIDRELANQPEAQADLLHAIAEISLSLGGYERARALAVREVELRQTIDGGSDRRALAGALNTRGNAEVQLGEVDAAELTYREALRIRREVLGPAHLEVAQTLNDLAIALVEQSELDAAEIAYLEALEIQRAQLGENNSEVATTTSNLAGLYRYRDDAPEAERLYRLALAAWRVSLEPDHPLIASAVGDLAMVRRTQGALDEAEALGREGLAIQRRVLGPRHPSFSTQLNNLATVLRDKGDHAGAEELLREVVEIDREQLGNEHPWLAISLDNLASALAEQDRHAEALPLFEEALSIHQATRGVDHPSTAISLRRQAETLAALGRTASALELANRALEIVTARLEPHHPGVIGAYATRAAVLLARGELAGAERDFRTALRLTADPDRSDRVRLLLGLGEVLLAEEQAENAEPVLREALELADARLPAGHPQRSLARSLLGGALAACGRSSEARPLLTAGWRGLRVSRGETHRETVEARRRLDAQ